MYNFGISRKLYTLEYDITQGSLGGALISTVNLDYTVDLHFKKSRHELSYGDVMIQLLIFKLTCLECVQARKQLKLEIT